MIHKTIEYLFYFTIVAAAFYFLSAEIDQWEREISGFYQIGRN
jgi:hypothetical protein